MDTFTFPKIRDPLYILDAHQNQAEKYREEITEGSETYQVQPCIIVAVGSRESGWGLLLKPVGPEGTGDFAKRQPNAIRTETELPPDGGGFGRGLMQIDYDAHKFARGETWKDPRENILYACRVLSVNWNWLQKKTEARGIALLRATLAAYNAGLGRITQAVKNGKEVNAFTTHRNYAKDVLNRAAYFQSHGWN